MTTCITTTVDEKYFPYIPLFYYCVKKAYPDYHCVIFTRGESGYGFPYRCHRIEPDTYNKSPYAAAALRFLCGERVLAEYDNVLITDADILIQRQAPDIVQQHLSFMRCNDLVCYSNCDHRDHMSGVHFVTQRWWNETRRVREQYLKVLEKQDTPLSYDEVILRNVVVESGLPVTPKQILWNTHGIHLGRFRNKGINAVRFRPDEFEFLNELMIDENFMSLVAEACQKSKLVRGVWESVLALYKKRRDR